MVLAGYRPLLTALNTVDRLSEMLRMVKVAVADSMNGWLCNSMRDWKTVLMSNGEVSQVKWGSNKKYSRRTPCLHLAYKFGKDQRLIQHLLFMAHVDLKPYERSDREMKSLINVVQVFPQDAVGMEFGMDKGALLVLKQGVKVHCEGIVLPDDQVMGEVEEGADIMHKEKVKQEYLRMVKLVVRSKSCGRNLIRVINAWPIDVLKYSAAILDWSDQELRVIDVKMKKRLMMFGAFHKKGSAVRLYIKRKDGGMGLISE